MFSSSFLPFLEAAGVWDDDSSPCESEPESESEAVSDPSSRLFDVRTVHYFKEVRGEGRLFNGEIMRGIKYLLMRLALAWR